MSCPKVARDIRQDTINVAMMREREKEREREGGLRFNLHYCPFTPKLIDSDTGLRNKKETNEI
jgi:hypothetical protein